MDNMDLLKLIVFEACEDGRVDDFDKQDMLNFIEEAVKLQDKKEHDKILSANRKENLRDDDYTKEFAILAELPHASGKVELYPRYYSYGTINNKVVSKKTALQELVNGQNTDCGLVSFNYKSLTDAENDIKKFNKEYNRPGMSDYQWAQNLAKLKNKCSLMTAGFKKDCDKYISKYKK